MTAARSPEGIRVLHVTPEAVPFRKVGGLADVAGSLPPALQAAGTDCRLLLPAWDGVLDGVRDRGMKLTRIPQRVDVAIRWQIHKGTLWKSVHENTAVYFLESPFFQGKEIYPYHLNPDSVLPFVFLSLAALDFANAAKWTPDVIHCHDWGTAPLIIALRWHQYYRTAQPRYKTIFTIHNLAHQGHLPLHSLREWGIADEAFSLNGVEYFGGANLMKGALEGASAITTVSPTYAREIQTEEGGVGLASLLRSQSYKLSGILNGLDTDYWNPETDPLLPANFSERDISGKKACREALLKEIGWKDDGRPLFVSVGRMVDQKGFDILLPAVGSMIEQECRLFILGSGQPEYESGVHDATSRWGDSVASFIGYEENLAHLAYAGGDFFLMPSKFEPCGLSQLISLRYGTVPVARLVGGLADTVFENDTPDANGFLFHDYSSDDLLAATGRAINAFRDEERMDRLRKAGMRSDFSWERSAPLYLDLYRSLLP